MILTFFTKFNYGNGVNYLRLTLMAVVQVQPSSFPADPPIPSSYTPSSAAKDLKLRDPSKYRRGKNDQAPPTTWRIS